MSCAEFSSQKYSCHLDQEDDRADQLDEEARKEFNAEKAKEAQEIRDRSSQTRTAAKKVGVPLSQIYVLKGGEGNGTQTMGMYERKLGVQGRTGMTNMNNFYHVTGNKDITRDVENTLLHEWKGHRAAHGRSISKGNDGKLQARLGAEDAEAIDEANAMEQEKAGNPEIGKPVEYKRYKERTRQISSELRIDVATLLANGDEDQIADKAEEKEKKEAQKEGEMLIFPSLKILAKAA